MAKTITRKAKPFDSLSLSENLETLEAEIHGNALVSASQAIHLADQKYELMRLKERIEIDLAHIDEALKAGLEEGDVIATHHGVGYRLNKAVQDVYDQRVIPELSKMHLLPRFVRVSTTRLRDLVQEGRLSEKKFEALREEYATPKEIISLREVPLSDEHAR